MASSARSKRAKQAWQSQFQDGLRAHVHAFTAGHGMTKAEFLRRVNQELATYAPWRPQLGRQWISKWLEGTQKHADVETFCAMAAVLLHASMGRVIAYFPLSEDDPMSVNSSKHIYLQGDTLLDNSAVVSDNRATVSTTGEPLRSEGAAMAEHEPTGGATPPIALAIGQVVEAIARTGDTGALDEAMSAVFAIYTRIRRSAPSTDAHTSFPTGDQPQTADTHKP